MIKEVFANYTGGGIWVFTGKLQDGNHFIADDDGDVLIVDAEIDWDESFYPEWQEEHLVEELCDKKAKEFWKEMLDCLENSDENHRDGFGEFEFNCFREWIKEKL